MFALKRKTHQSQEMIKLRPCFFFNHNVPHVVLNQIPRVFPTKYLPNSDQIPQNSLKKRDLYVSLQNSGIVLKLDISESHYFLVDPYFSPQIPWLVHPMSEAHGGH